MIKQQYIVLYAKDGRTSLGFVKLGYGGNAVQVAARVTRLDGASAVLSLDDGIRRERFDLVADRSGLFCTGTAQLSGGRTTAAVHDAGGLLALGESSPPRQSWYAAETGLGRAASAVQQVDAASLGYMSEASKEPAMSEASLPQGAAPETFAPDNEYKEADTTIRVSSAAAPLSHGIPVPGSPDFNPAAAPISEEAKSPIFDPPHDSSDKVCGAMMITAEEEKTVSDLSGKPACAGTTANPPDLSALEMPAATEPIEHARGCVFDPPPDRPAVWHEPLNPFLEDRPADKDAQAPPLFFEPLLVPPEEAVVQFEQTWDAARPDVSAGKAHSRFGLSSGATQHWNRNPPDMDSAAPPQREEPISGPVKSVGAGGQTSPPATADHKPDNGEDIFLFVKGAYADLWRWRRVTSGERGFSYLLGEVLIEDKVVAVAVAVPGSYAPSPPAHLQGFSAYRDGHWLLAQDAATGESIPI